MDWKGIHQWCDKNDGGKEIRVCGELSSCDFELIQGRWNSLILIIIIKKKKSGQAE
jgi:hypothetical protein